MRTDTLAAKINAMGQNHLLFTSGFAKLKPLRHYLQVTISWIIAISLMLIIMKKLAEVVSFN